ncbi:MAG: SsrA-binding protein [Alphaproteobacteria bacterium 32-64-14]|nr:MAG: SsrA-binding protein [Alphaproteobacteria bacterium 32-64-14]
MAQPPKSGGQNPKGKTRRQLAQKMVAENRQARRNYEIVDSLEVGIVLTGSEVKSLREGRANIAEAYAREEDGQIVMVNATIPTYPPAGQFNHDPGRKRILLVKKREYNRLMGAVNREGRTLVPLELYFGPTGVAKIKLALATGRKAPDKRDVEKKRDWDRQKGRILRARG